MDGWSRKMCPSWFTAVLREDQLELTERRTLFLRLHRTAHTSTLERRHTAAVQAAAENICRGQTPTCRRPSVFAFLWRNCICGKTSNIHSPDFQMCYTQKKAGPLYGHDCRCFASSCGGAGPSSLQQEGAAALDPHQEKTQDPHTERTQWTNSGANDLLTCSPHMTFLSHYLFGHC